jgi:hypothetical protein
MKSKVLILISTLAMALGLIAQSTTQPAAPAGGDDAAKSCACCNHDKADGKMSCCGKGTESAGKGSDCCKGGTCCEGKDGKTCAMMSKDQSGKMSCCSGGKCPMMSKEHQGKGCCGGKMCERPQAGA